MKQYVLTLSLILGTLFFVQAQQKVPTATELADKNIEALDKKLKLNPTQRNIIYNYTLDLYKEQMDLNKKQQAGIYNEDSVTRFFKFQNATNANIRKILTSSQQKDYDLFLDEQMRGGAKKKKKGKRAKDEEEEVVTGIEGLKLPPATPLPENNNP
ncbi:hypothetical protein ACSBL2_14745 [Pedobacter sp. AW31-3R]|uniref:hypothetical protein n=1 Tax=Pedobacter sp. AW31-3R TaxID=3445781 RepID=UPI003FA0864C